MAKKKAVTKHRKKEQTRQGNYSVRVAFVTLDNEVLEGELTVDLDLIEKHTGGDDMRNFLDRVDTFFGRFQLDTYDEPNSTMILKEVKNEKEKNDTPILH